MTINVFLEELYKTKNTYDWRVVGGCLRGYNKISVFPYCPVTAVCLERTGYMFRSWDAQTAASRLGLTRDDGLDIIRTSDDKNENPDLFNKLIKVLNV